MSDTNDKLRLGGMALRNGLRERLGATLEAADPKLLGIVDTIFDALGCMFARGALRHWPDLVEAA